MVTGPLRGVRSRCVEGATRVKLLLGKKKEAARRMKWLSRLQNFFLELICVVRSW